MSKLEITKKETVDKMVESLEQKAKDNNVDLSGLRVDNFNCFLDNAFGDGGEARCEDFGDIAIPYALQFGEFDGDIFHEKRWSCLESALKRLQKKYTKPEDYSEIVHHIGGFAQ